MLTIINTNRSTFRSAAAAFSVCSGTCVERHHRSDSFNKLPPSISSICACNVVFMVVYEKENPLIYLLPCNFFMGSFIFQPFRNSHPPIQRASPPVNCGSVTLNGPSERTHGGSELASWRLPRRFPQVSLQPLAELRAQHLLLVLSLPAR